MLSPGGYHVVLIRHLSFLLLIMLMSTGYTASRLGIFRPEAITEDSKSVRSICCILILRSLL